MILLKEIISQLDCKYSNAAKFLVKLAVCSLYSSSLHFKSNVEEGWTTLSLQLSGMFFLISLVLFIICEYLYNLNNSTNDGPLFHIGQEFKSENNQNFEKLNIEDLEN